MSEVKTIDIRYVGRKEIRKDNINRTKIVWFGKNDVKPYPADLAGGLLSFPDTWVKDSGEAVEETAQPKAQNFDAGDELIAAENTAKEKAALGDAVIAASLTSDQAESESEAVDQERVKAIKIAFTELESKDLNDKGFPLIASVREKSGIEDLKQKEVNDLWRESQE